DIIPLGQTEETLLYIISHFSDPILLLLPTQENYDLYSVEVGKDGQGDMDVKIKKKEGKGVKKKEKLENMKKEMDINDHELTIEELELKYQTNITKGMKSSYAGEVLIRDGPNELKPPKGTPEYVKFARQLAGGLQCLMWVAAVICLIAFGIQESQGDLTAADNVS
ncbi:hypothetical protein GDO81_024043, partial [Engystomops pustulosus]